MAKGKAPRDSGSSAGGPSPAMIPGPTKSMWSNLDKIVAAKHAEAKEQAQRRRQDLE